MGGHAWRAGLSRSRSPCSSNPALGAGRHVRAEPNLPRLALPGSRHPHRSSSRRQSSGAAQETSSTTLSRRRFASRAKARMACFSYIEGWYTPGRLHSGLGYGLPMTYEAKEGGRPDPAVARKPENLPRERGNLTYRRDPPGNGGHAPEWVADLVATLSVWTIEHRRRKRCGRSSGAATRDPFGGGAGWESSYGGCGDRNAPRVGASADTLLMRDRGRFALYSRRAAAVKYK